MKENITTVSKLPKSWASEVRKKLNEKKVFVSSAMVEATILNDRHNKHFFIIKETFKAYVKEYENQINKLNSK